MGKLALVTGASRGIGRAVAVRLAKDGFDIIVAYRSNLEAANETAEMVRGHGQQAFLASLDVGAGSEAEQAVGALLEEYGCPDVLVNNAGVTKDGLFPMMGRASWESVLETNLGSFYSVTRPVLRKMIRKRVGRIITVTSVSGQRGNAGQVNYSASKAGLIGATKALALEVGSRNITVNAVAPGFIDTDMTSSIDAEKVTEHIPLGRVGSPADVAGAVAFLCSADASYITGQVLSVNGGMYT
jgi:3-oxoacyl-[acyl-carrier protein] reductase